MPCNPCDVCAAQLDLTGMDCIEQKPGWRAHLKWSLGKLHKVSLPWPHDYVSEEFPGSGSRMPGTV